LRALAALALMAAAAAPVRAEWGWGQRYSHAAHAQKMAARGQKPPGCMSCHSLDAQFAPTRPGGNEHRPCVDCHGGAEFTRGPRCLTCHSSIRTMKPGAPWFPPFRVPGDFHVELSHARHVAAAGETCGDCHRPQAGTASAARGGHAACAACHATRARPEMTSCEGCHKLGARTTVSAAASRFAVEDFSHLGHQQRVARKHEKASCTSCHIGLERAARPGKPTMAACETCHDGQSAFDARGTRCARCHKGEAPSPVAAAPPSRFSHAAHAGRGVDMGRCAGCHRAGTDWRAGMPGRDEHRPCQNAACHAAEFGKPGSPICGSCHERSEPFAPNPLRRPPIGAGEFRAASTMHAPHLQQGMSCAACHAGGGGARSDGHAQCVQCHKPGARLTLEGCGACHVAPMTAGGANWSVAARFRHDANHHLACERCHREGGSADLTRPTMAGCGSCHDGKQAFKTTGFGCARCHGAAKS
jgi:hypothetical protein